MSVERIDLTHTRDTIIDGVTEIGNFARLDIQEFPENVSRLFLYVRAWGHKSGDPSNDASGFFDGLIGDVNQIAGELMPFTTKSKDRPGFRNPLVPRAYVDVWINDVALTPNQLAPGYRPLYDRKFDNYEFFFYCDWPIPEPRTPFSFVVSHGNAIATADGFDAFIEITTQGD